MYIHTFICNELDLAVGWFKTPVSSQTDKLMAATKFSDYLGVKHYKKQKIKHFFHLRLAQQPQCEFRPPTKKVCSSDVRHCQISIFEKD